MSKKSKKLIEFELSYEVLAKLDTICPGSAIKMESHVLDGLKPIVRKFFKTISKKERAAIESKLSGQEVKSSKGTTNKTKKVAKKSAVKLTKVPAKRPSTKSKRKK